MFCFKNLFYKNDVKRSALAVALSCALTLVSIGMSANSAQASAQQCAYLKKQLQSGGSSNYAKYDAAAEKQSTQIWYVKRDMRRAGCNTSNSSQCRSMNSTLSKMNANYVDLVRKREASRGISSSLSRSIKAKMDALNCSGAKARPTTKSVVVRRGEKQTTVPVPIAPSAPSAGEYRTMCVRTCDGYYFPVSYASTKGDLKRDEAICNSLCPATEAHLYIHRNADQESEDMVSLKGDAYTSLPTAFLYRKSNRSPSCSCGAADPNALGVQESGKKTGEKEVVDPFLEKLPAPMPRPDLYADVETQNQAESGLSAKIVRQFISKSEDTDLLVDASGRKIRVVGLEFLPDPATAIDLRAPAPTSVQ